MAGVCGIAWLIKLHLLRVHLAVPWLVACGWVAGIMLLTLLQLRTVNDYPRKAIFNVLYVDESQVENPRALVKARKVREVRAVVAKLQAGARRSQPAPEARVRAQRKVINHHGLRSSECLWLKTDAFTSNVARLRLGF